MEILKLGPEHADIARGLARRFYGSAASRVYLAEVLSDPANVLVVALAPGDGHARDVEAGLAGFLYGHWLDRLKVAEQQLFIYEIEVAEEFRRRGVATALMRTALELAGDRDAETFVLTNRANDAATALYERLGGVQENPDDVMYVFPPRR